MSLNPQQFGRLFHGTSYPLEGDTLLPGKRFGASGGQDEWKHLGQSKNDFVSATDSEDRAWTFAYQSKAQLPGMTGRVRVHEVEPNEQTRIGVEHVDHPKLQEAFASNWYKKPQPAGEHVAPYFKVKQTLDIKPGHQGTFPEEDWNRYQRKPKPGEYHPGDANHPGDPSERGSEQFRQRRRGAEMARDTLDEMAKNQGTLF